MHRLNPYLNNRPNFGALAAAHPPLNEFVSGDDQASIDFQNPAALRALTEALLKVDFGYTVHLREDRLCPTIANRLDYLLRVLDLEPYLPPHDGPLRILDIGTGHVAIYPLLLHHLRPTAKIFATELDPVSLAHAKKTIEQNGLQNSITLLQAEKHGSLIPMRKREGRVDIVVCNPPFFGSALEMEEGQALKTLPASAAPTGATGELITPGGETSFIKKMIDESFKLGEACGWYTSLVGKYASLAPLVEHLRALHCDNYFVQSFKPSRTARWILGWSHSSIRLPDSFSRPPDLMPGTSFTRLLAPRNEHLHRPHPAMSVPEIRDRVLGVLRDVHLNEDKPHTDTDTDGPTPAVDLMEVTLEPRRNTWSRQARRQALHAASASNGAEGTEDANAETVEPLFRAKVVFEPPSSSDESHVATSDAGGSSIPAKRPAEGSPLPDVANDETKSPAEDNVAPDEKEAIPESSGWEARHASEAAKAGLRLVWLEGRDRALVEAFWHFLLRKAGLIREADKPLYGDSSQGRGTGRGRGDWNRVRGRGRGRIKF